MSEKSTHTFVVSDESINSYGTRILTEGIDISQYKRNPVVLYMHHRNHYGVPTGDEVIGKALKIYKSEGKLMADIVFDENNPFAKKIADKVKGGFIKMCSAGIRIKSHSEDKKHIVLGQKRPTITESELKEISIVDIGSNNEALKLYDDDGGYLTLSSIPTLHHTQKPHKKMSLTAINKALGLKEDASEVEVVQAIGALKLSAEDAQTRLADIEKADKAKKQKEFIELFDKAVEVGAVHASLKESYIKLSEQNFEQTCTPLKEAIASKTEASTQGKKQHQSTQMNQFLDSLGKTGGSKAKAINLADYSHEELEEMQKNEPEKFEKLMDAYEGLSM